MSSKKKGQKGLGRGLGDIMGVSELLGQIQQESAAVAEKAPPPVKKATTKNAAPAKTKAPKGTRFQTVPVSQLSPGPFQPRRKMDQNLLQELADSIKAQGIIQPIVARQVDGRFEIIAGERRWRAAQLAECDTVPVIIRDLPDQTVMAIALIENIQRQDLNVMEESLALKRLIDEFGMTHQEVAKAVGRSRAAVTNLLRLLKCHAEVRELVEQGHLDMGHARALLALPEEKQPKVAKVVVARGLSVRQTEQLIQRYLHPEEKKPESTRRDPNIITLEREISERLGADVAIQEQGSKGKVVIQYHSLAELEGILAHMSKRDD